MCPELTVVRYFTKRMAKRTRDSDCVVQKKYLRNDLPERS